MEPQHEQLTEQEKKVENSLDALKKGVNVFGSL